MRGAEVPRLVTERLLLRGWEQADKPAWAAINADPEVMAHFPSTLCRADSDAMVDRMIATWSERGFGAWAVERRDTAEMIGFVLLSAPDWEASFTPCVEVGWRLGRAHWGHGFAGEGAQAAIDWAFAHLDLPNDEIVAFTTVANAKSRRVMDKLGFVHDPAGDFDHPLTPGWREARHVLYRMRRAPVVGMTPTRHATMVEWPRSCCCTGRT